MSEKLWHNRRSSRVLLRIKRRTHQRNGSSRSDSDSGRWRSFIVRDPCRHSSRCNGTTEFTVCEFVGPARSAFTRSVTFRNAGRPKANQAMKTLRVCTLAGLFCEQVPLVVADSNHFACDRSWRFRLHSGRQRRLHHDDVGVFVFSRLATLTRCHILGRTRVIRCGSVR